MKLSYFTILLMGLSCQVASRGGPAMCWKSKELFINLGWRPSGVNDTCPAEGMKVRMYNFMVENWDNDECFSLEEFRAMRAELQIPLPLGPPFIPICKHPGISG